MVFLAALFSLAAAVSAAAAGSPAALPSNHLNQAWVSLLYGDQFLLGLRVLGQSLRDTGTTRCGRLMGSKFMRAAHERRPPSDE